ncbi:uncharacterized protein [Temnothorax longispinosus]|uniref:uncharacterized protein isoform X1 n=1 Tax=Temnothorax longispinosus TaxID=300112 RepID=UPI003A99560D
MDHEYSQYKIVGIATFNRDVTNVMLKEHIINKVDMANATVNNVDVLEKVDDTYLVELYRERRFLYDKSHPDFKDNELKSNAWKEISSIMRDKNLGTFYTAEYCKRRLTNLREQYVRLKKEQTLKSGSTACSKKKSALLSELSFLDGYIQRRRTLTSMKKNNGRMPPFSFDKNATKCPETNVTESINLNKRTYKKILPRPNNIGDDLTKNLYDQTPSKILKQNATSKKNNEQQQQFDVGSTSVEHAFAKFIALSLQRMEEPERSIRRNKIFHDLTAPLEHVQSGPCDKKSPARSMVSGIAVTKNTHPIRVTHAALAWNSVKTGKSEIKEFTIHNTSNNKIEIQIDICDDNKSFKFIGDKQTINTSMVLTMRHQEIKTLAVAFNPYCVGPVVGKITIKHYTKESSDPQSQQYKKIPLYGYGGCSKVKIAGTFKDLSGNMWLSLGTLYSETTLSANIRLNNVGDLRSFAKITVIPKVTFSTNSSWHVNPKEVILNAKESQQIAIQFHPKKEDFAFVQHSEVSHIATINITYGDEPTRWRIRSVCDKIKPDELTKNENEDVISIVFPICKSFPGEQLVPGIASLGDSIQNLSDLCSGVHQSEIMLTVEACTDDTLPVHDTADAEISVISDTIRVDEAGGV